MEGWIIYFAAIITIIAVILADKIRFFFEKKNVFIEKTIIRLISIIVGGVIIFSVLFYAYEKASEEAEGVHERLEEKIKRKEEREKEREQNALKVAEEAILQKQKWHYSTRTDEMTDKEKYYASCKSTNMVYLDFPYEGGTEATLHIRNIKGVNEILVTINKGQIQTYDEHSTIRLDNNKAKTYSITGSSDNSSDCAFIEAGNSLIQQIKKANIIKIQLPFYHNGIQTFTFNPGNLEWNY